MTEAVFRRAEGPYPLVVRTLDALHLASAELWLREYDAGAPPGDLALWTLDERLSRCAVQLGFSAPLLAD